MFLTEIRRMLYSMGMQYLYDLPKTNLDFARVSDLMKEFARAHMAKQPTTLPVCFRGDGPAYFAFYELNGIPEEYPTSSHHKLPNIIGVFRYLMEHPEEGVAEAYCTRMIESAENLQRNAASGPKSPVCS